MSSSEVLKRRILAQKEWLLSIVAHSVTFGSLAIILSHQPQPELNGAPGLSVVIENPMPAPAKRPSGTRAQSRKRITQKAQTAVAPEAIPRGQSQGTSEVQGVQGEGEGFPAPVAEFLVTEMPELVSEVRIPYPANARRNRVQGPVVMDLLVDSAGTVRKATLVEGPDPELSQAAVDAMKDFRFRPARVNEKAVAVQIRYTYRFVLD